MIHAFPLQIAALGRHTCVPVANKYVWWGEWPFLGVCDAPVYRVLALEEFGLAHVSIFAHGVKGGVELITAGAILHTVLPVRVDDCEIWISHLTLFTRLPMRNHKVVVEQLVAADVDHVDHRFGVVEKLVEFIDPRIPARHAHERRKRPPWHRVRAQEKVVGILVVVGGDQLVVVTKFARPGVLQYPHVVQHVAGKVRAGVHGNPEGLLRG